MGRGKRPTVQNMAEASLLSFSFPAFPLAFSFFPPPSCRHTSLRSKQHERGLCGGERCWLQISYDTKGGENYNPEKARVNFLEITSVTNNSNWHFSLFSLMTLQYEHSMDYPMFFSIYLYDKGLSWCGLGAGDTFPSRQMQNEWQRMWVDWTTTVLRGTVSRATCSLSHFRWRVVYFLYQA